MQNRIAKLLLVTLAIDVANATRQQSRPWNTLAETSSFEKQELQLAERRGGSSRSTSRSYSTYSSSSGGGDDWGIGSFILGCVMIPFSLVLLWKNEKKLVTYAKVIDEARDECRTVEADAPNDENDYKLVHCIGDAVNAEEISDQTFGATCENSYRLVRTVEMY